MVIYCMSDIHGELDKFERMLDLIHFSDEDHLYILGDVIDRGALGVDILRRIMEESNMTMLLGNHEQMCLSTLGTHNEFGARDLWRMNGGSSTYRELLYHRTHQERNEILHFLSDLPDHLELTVGEQKFHLVHGRPQIRVSWSAPGHPCTKWNFCSPTVNSKWSGRSERKCRISLRS